MRCLSHPVDLPIAAPAARIAEDERLYVVGDIHGRLDLFRALVARIRQDNATRGPARVRLILLGDLIDRGPDSAEVVTRCEALAARSPDFLVLKGNHEAMMTDGLRGNMAAFALWMRSGGDAALRSWGVTQALLDEGASPGLIAAGKRHVPATILAWLDALPVRHSAGDYLFVHAGIRPGIGLASQSAEDMMWIRREFLESEADHACIVVHGHSIAESGVVIQPNRIGIDTGAYRTGVLTALALQDDRRWTLSTDARDEIALQAPLAAVPESAARRRAVTVGPFPPGTLEADVSAILDLEDEPDQPAPDAKAGRWPRVAIPAGLVLAAASLAAVLLVRPPDAPPVPGVAAIDRVTRVAVGAAPSPERRGVLVALPDVPAPQPTTAQLATRDEAPRITAAPAPPREAQRGPVRDERPKAAPKPPVSTEAGLAIVQPAPPPAQAVVRPEGSAGDAVQPPPDAELALTADREARPSFSPAFETPPVERIRTERSIDAIKSLRRQ